MKTKYFTLSTLTDILKSYSQKSEYSTSKSFYYNVIFAAEIKENPETYDIRTKYYLSELASLKFEGQLSQNKLAAEISKLIVLFYKGELNTIANILQQDFSSLPPTQLNQLNNKLNENISSNSISSITNSISSITPDNIGKKLVACILLAFYYDKMPGKLQIQSKNVKAAIDLLRLNDIDLKKFVSDFTRYKLTYYGAIDYSNWNLTYNITTLIKLYLNINDSQSKEKRSIYSHKKYVPSSTEEEETIADFKLIGQLIEAYINEIMNKDIPIEDKISLIDKFFKILYAKYPEFQDLKSQDLRGLEKENNEKNDRHR